MSTGGVFGSESRRCLFFFHRSFSSPFHLVLCLLVGKDINGFGIIVGNFSRFFIHFRFIRLRDFSRLQKFLQFRSQDHPGIGGPAGGIFRPDPVIRRTVVLIPEHLFGEFIGPLRVFFVLPRLRVRLLLQPGNKRIFSLGSGSSRSRSSRSCWSSSRSCFWFRYDGCRGGCGFGFFGCG